MTVAVASPFRPASRRCALSLSSTREEPAFPQAGLVNRALRLAALAHHHACRLDGSPALWHPLDVCRQLQDHGIADAELLAASLVHDALEDNPAHQGELLEITAGTHDGLEEALRRSLFEPAWNAA